LHNPFGQLVFLVLLLSVSLVMGKHAVELRKSKN
jgi:hypothetical protein